MSPQPILQLYFYKLQFWWKWQNFYAWYFFFLTGQSSLWKQLDQHTDIQFIQKKTAILLPEMKAKYISCAMWADLLLEEFKN